jgi:hypothetical protein
MDFTQAAARVDELGLFAEDSLVPIVFPSESILIAESPRLDYSTTLAERSHIYLARRRTSGIGGLVCIRLRVNQFEKRMDALVGP